MYTTIRQMREANKARGLHWFSPDTMRFFQCEIYPRVWPGGYFLSSEKSPHGKRAWTVRRCVDGTVQTIGEFNTIQTIREAIETVERITVKGEAQ